MNFSLYLAIAYRKIFSSNRIDERIFDHNLFGEQSMANMKSEISFGLVNIPVIYNPIIKNNDTSFNQLHKKCLSRVHYQKYCDHCKKPLKETDIIKGYEYEKDKYVTFTKEELSDFQVDAKGTIEIISFVPESEVSPLYYEKSYVLSTPKKSKSYSLFLEVLKKSKKIAVAKTALASKFYYVLLRYMDGNILMSTIYFEEEVNLPEANVEASFSKAELDLAMKLVEHLSGHFTPEKYEDDYQNRIKVAIDKKVEGKPVPKTKTKKKESIKDLMTSLQKSLEG